MSNATPSVGDYQYRVTREHHAPGFLLFIFGVCTVTGILRSTRLRAKMLSPILDLILFFVGVGYGFLTQVEKFPSVLNFTDVYELGPYTLKCIWLPLLLFQAVFAMDARTFASLFLQVVFLGSFGFALIVTLRALFVYYAFILWYNWPVWICVIYASVTSLTDPALILKLFKEIGSYKTLCRLLEGEHFIMVAAACFAASYVNSFHLVDERVTYDWNFTESRILFIFEQFIAAPVFGYLIGRITVAWLTIILNDPAIEVILVISIGYLTFLISSILNMSSVLAVLSYMLVLSDRRVCLYLSNDSYLQRMFDILKIIASSCILVLAGIQLTRQRARISTIESADVLMTLALYFQYIFTRGFLATLMLPFLYVGGFRMTLPEGASIVWCETHRATTLLLGMSVCHAVLAKQGVNAEDFQRIFKLYFHICGLFVLTSFINGTTTTIALDFFGMRHVPLFKRITMASAIQLLREVIQSTLKTYRGDRFLADADWDIVYKHVYLEVPYKSGYVTEINLEDLIEGVKPLGTKRQSSNKKRDMQSMQTEVHDVKVVDAQDELRDARLKIFRAKKASFWRQFQHGMLSLEAVRSLVESIDYARDDSEHIKNIEKMMKYCEVKGVFKQTSFVKRKFEEMEHSVKRLHTETMEEIKDIPIRKFFFNIYDNGLTKLFVNIVLLTNFFVVLAGIILMWRCTTNDSLKFYDRWLDNVNYVIIAIYSCMVLCKLIVFGKLYFTIIINYIELIIVVISYVELALRETVFSKREITSDEQLYCYTGPVYVTMNAGYRKLVVISTVLLSTRFLRTFRLFEMHSKRLISFINEQLQLRLKLGYDIGKGYVTCVEEVTETLDNLIDNREIRDRYKEQMTFLRLSRMKELASLQKTYPGIVLSVKSQHAGRRILNNLFDRISQLRRDGMLDEKESDKLEQMIAARLKLLLKIPPDIPLPAPGKVLSEIPWVAGDQDFIEYIQNNAKLVGMAEGEVLDADSNPYGGLYIIISGLVRVDMYLHESSNMPGKARAPVSAAMAAAAAKEQEKCSDYLTTGSTLGEMALLTTAAHKTIATCETTVQLYHFEYEAVQAALELYVIHPSLEYKLWEACSAHVAYALMKKRLPYRNMPTDDLKLVIENGLLFVNPWTVPDGGKFQEDGVRIDLRPLSRFEIIVVYGTASTVDGFETFRGPCVVPVGVDHIWFQPHDTDKYVIYVVPRDALLLGSHLSPAEFGGSSYGDKDDASRLFVEAFIKKSIISQPTGGTTTPGNKETAPERLSISGAGGGGGVFPVDGGPADLRRRSTFVGGASSNAIHRLNHVESDRRLSMTTGPPPVTPVFGMPLARRFSVSSSFGVADKEFTDLPTPPVAPALSQRKMSSPSPKIPESFAAKKRLTQSKEKRDSL